MARQHALRFPGGARGEQNVGDVGGCHALMRRTYGLGRHPPPGRQELRPRLRGRSAGLRALAQNHDALQVRQRLRRDELRVARAEKLTDRHQQTRAAASQDEGGLAALEARVQGHEHRTCAQCPECGHHPVAAIGGPDAHPVPGEDAGAQVRRARAASLMLEVAEAELLPLVNERRRVAEEFRGARQHTRDRRWDVGVHTLKIANHTVRCDLC